MAVIAAAKLKGGVGATSIVANVAGELAALGRRIVVLDADPQRSLTSWAGLGSGVLSRIVEAADANDPVAFKARVDAARRGADHVLIDAPPGFTDAGLVVALVADLVLVPSGPSPLDLLATREAIKLVRESRAKDGRPRIALIPSRVTATGLGRELLAALRGIGEQVLPAIGQRVVVAASALDGKTVGEFSGSSAAAEEFRALARAVEKAVR
jgi:chromosome partitioning protein